MISAKAGYNVKASFRSGLLIGIGIMAGVDEIIFHQLLGWHHFYDRSTPNIGIPIRSISIVVTSVRFASINTNIKNTKI